MSLDFFTVVMLMGFVQGLILAIVLFTKAANNKAANRQLALLLCFLSAMLFSKTLLVRYPSVLLFQRLSLIDPVIFLFGPMLYRYLNLLLKESPRFTRSYLVYLPSVLYFAYLGYTNFTPLKDYYSALVNGDFNLLFFIVELAALVHIGYYWVISSLMLAKYSNRDKTQASFKQSAFEFTRISHYVIGLVLLLWLIGFIGTYFINIKSFDQTYTIIWIVLPVLVYIIGFFAIKRPEIFKKPNGDLAPLKEAGKKTYQRLPNSEITQLKMKLDKLLENEKPYLDHTLTLSTLAKKLDTSTNNLSWLLNKVYGTNFYDLINKLRIKEFIKKIENKEHLGKTLLALSLETGFNSKSTFNKVFKAIQKETPTSYVKRIGS